MKYVIALAAGFCVSPALAVDQPITNEPYPYYKEAGNKGYEPYISLPGCAWYQLQPGGKVQHICDRTSPEWLFKLQDQEGVGSVR